MHFLCSMLLQASALNLRTSCLHSAILCSVSLACENHQETVYRQSFDNAPHTLIQPLQNGVELLFTKISISSIAQSLECLVAGHTICINQTGQKFSTPSANANITLNTISNKQ